MSSDDRTPELCGWSCDRVRGNPALAWVFVGLSGGGLVAAVWHWQTTGWPRRAQELRGFEGLVGDVTVRDLIGGPVLPSVGPLLLVCGALLGAAVFAAPLARRLSCAAAWTLALLAVLHLVESVLLTAVLDGELSVWLIITLQGFAFVEYGLTAPATLFAVLGAGTAVLRLLTRHRAGGPDPSGVDAAAPGRDDVPGERGGGDQANWREGFGLPPGRQLQPASMGICLSGGGIRSATFTLGALQALQERPALDAAAAEKPSELGRARYLAAVSGGAYTAGAFCLAGRKPRDSAAYGRSADDAERCRELNFEHAFRPGSPEFDHLRRHSSYLADSLREWAGAIFVVVRGAAVATLFLYLLMVVAGRWAGHLYHWVRRESALADPWQPVWGAVFAVMAIAGMAGLLWLLSLATWARPPKVRRWSREAAFMASVALVILVVLSAGIPIVTWTSMRVLDLSVTPGGALPTGGVLGVVGIVTSAIGLLSRQHSSVAKAVRAVPTTWLRHLGDTGKLMLQWLAVLGGLALVISVYLVVFGHSTWNTAITDPDNHPLVDWGTPDWPLPLSDFQLTVALTGLLLLLYFFVDETATGLQPFYRRRLATAFAVRRYRNDALPHGFEALEYPSDEVTELERYAPKGGGGRGPQVIFCAAAHCSDPAHTPPGRHVLPFTFSHDFVGGPEVGWCSPAVMRGAGRPGRRTPGQVSDRLARELTVQSAMAVSGAAFASATGTGRVPANLLLALVNARLGTWLPNPGPPKTMREHQSAPWWRARPPRWRRMSYFVRELFAWHPRDFPMLFVTDGAHYEGLGLVELLRHRCHEIYCFDASSDTDAFARAIAQSVTLAYDELGVRVELDDPETAQPAGAGAEGSVAVTGAGAEDAGRDTTKLNDALAARLANSAVITGRVIYPPGDPRVSRRDGILVIGRAVLTRQTPWEVRRHAAAHPFFPQDATGDQWFDDRKFNAYTGLGRYVGECAVKAMERKRAQVRAQYAKRLASADPDWWQINADRDVKAMLALGAVHRGDDPDTAFAWWERAARAGNHDAQVELGVLLSGQNGGPPFRKDLASARGWLLRAAGAGDQSAAFNLGVLDAERNDLDAACQWFERVATASGDTDAIHNLGMLLARRGLREERKAAGGADDLARRWYELSRQWYEVATAAGHAAAMNELGLVLMSRAGVGGRPLSRADLTEARGWFEQGARAGNVDAGRNLARLLTIGEQLDRDPAALPTLDEAVGDHPVPHRDMRRKSVEDIEEELANRATWQPTGGSGDVRTP